MSNLRASGARDRARVSLPPGAAFDREPRAERSSRVRRQLREGTRQGHERVEQAPIFRRLLSADVSPADHRRVLASLLGFVEPLEAQLACWLSAEHCPRSAERLQADLRRSGLDSAGIASLPRCGRLPVVSSSDEAFGVAWVIHGSALGGVMIHRHLSSRLGAEAMAGFRHFGPEPPAQWRGFLAALADVTDPARAEKAARETFTALDAWLREMP